MKRFHILTLGCPKNTVDSENIQSLLSTSGFLQVEMPEEADILMVNTCGFIEAAKRESIDEILGIAERKNPDQRLIVFGCLSQRYGGELIKEIPEIDAVLGVDDTDRIIRYCKDITNHEDAVDNNRKDINSFPHPFTFSPIYPSRSHAYLKIAEGCDRHCSFCTIPSIRGRFRSFSPDKILKRAESCINSGVKELILIAQDITSYGSGSNGYGLHELIKDITSISGDFWLRLLYLYPTAIDDRLLEVISENRKVCRYIDIPLQHSEDRILRLMKRGGSRDSYMSLVNKVRKTVPNIALRTSFIVGFPSETEEDFRSLLDFVSKCRFESMGAFTYSREEGTVSYGLKGHIPKRKKEERYHEIMSLQSEISFEKNCSMLGKRLRVIIDEIDGGVAICRHYGQAPEIDGSVIVDIPGNGDRAPAGSTGAWRVGDFLNVRIAEAYTYDLKGKPV